jgi:hypothetical protein
MRGPACRVRVRARAVRAIDGAVCGVAQCVSRPHASPVRRMADGPSLHSTHVTWRRVSLRLRRALRATRGTWAAERRTGSPGARAAGRDSYHRCTVHGVGGLGSASGRVRSHGAVCGSDRVFVRSEDPTARTAVRPDPRPIALDRSAHRTSLLLPPASKRRDHMGPPAPREHPTGVRARVFGFAIYLNL